MIYFGRKGIQSNEVDSGTPMALNNNHSCSQDKDGRHRSYYPTIPRGICNRIKVFNNKKKGVLYKRRK